MFYFIVLSLATATLAQSPCTTPLGEAAQCINISSCTLIKNALLSRNTTLIEAVKKFQCGYSPETKRPLVCCGSKLVQVSPRNNFLPERTHCGVQSTDDRIWGGQVTEIWEFPWMVLLGYRDGSGADAGFKCGGTLISKRYVLTAAHCLRGRFQSSFNFSYVRLGEHNLDTPQDCILEHDYPVCSVPVDIATEQNVIHLQHNPVSGDNDIALLRLNKDIKFTDYIRPICLPDENIVTPRVGTELVVAGWGSTETGEQSSAKLKVKVPVVDNAVCAARLNKSKSRITLNQICAGGEMGKDSCKGDSGGPLMHTFERGVGTKSQWYQEGVVSRGIGCGSLNYPGIYTRVASYLEWIANNMRQ